MLIMEASIYGCKGVAVIGQTNIVLYEQYRCYAVF